MAMTAVLNIWILDAFHAGSHAAWSLGAKRALEQAGHHVELLSLPGRHWKWRMHGAAATWAPLMKERTPPDVLLTTDMCDVAQLRGYMPPKWSHVKVVTMFHENQLTFPWSPDDPDAQNGRDNTYAYINVSTGLASDSIWFNSAHHRDVFLAAVEAWMKRMPKPHIPDVSNRLRGKSEVMHLGLDFEHWQPDSPVSSTLKDVDVPLILWNQRWSWDKGTDAWMDFVHRVLDLDLPAKFVILGASHARQPDGWTAMRERLGNRCVHWGYAESREEYVSWLWQATLAPVHPEQEYFGLSVVEAMRCGTIPWVPEAHAYRETMPSGHRFMPSSSWVDGLISKSWKDWPLELQAYESKALEFSWKERGPALAKAMDQLVTGR